MPDTLTAAQAAQQNNRDSGGKYATKTHPEADVALERDSATTGFRGEFELWDDRWRNQADIDRTFNDRILDFGAPDRRRRRRRPLPPTDA